MPDPKPTLDYQAPQPMVNRSYTSIRGTLLILLSIPFAIASIVVTVVGVGGLVSVSKEARGDRAEDVFVMLVVIFLGLFCGFTARRWFKEGLDMVKSVK